LQLTGRRLLAGFLWKRFLGGVLSFLTSSFLFVPRPNPLAETWTENPMAGRLRLANCFFFSLFFHWTPPVPSPRFFPTVPGNKIKRFYKLVWCVWFEMWPPPGKRMRFSFFAGCFFCTCGSYGLALEAVTRFFLPGRGHPLRLAARVPYRSLEQTPSMISGRDPV